MSTKSFFISRGTGWSESSRVIIKQGVVSRSLEQLGHILVLLLDPPVDLPRLVVQPVQDLVVFVELVVETGGQDLEARQSGAHFFQIPVENVVDGGAAHVVFDAATGSKP